VGDGFRISNGVPKRDIDARREALQRSPTNDPDRHLSTQGKKKDGRFFIFIIIVSIALVLGMAFLCDSLLKRADPAPMRRSHDGGRKDYIPTTSRTRRTSARAFIHGGLAALRLRHLSS